MKDLSNGSLRAESHLNPLVVIVDPIQTRQYINVPVKYPLISLLSEFILASEHDVIHRVY